MPSQRPYFLSSFIAAFRQQPAPSPTSPGSAGKPQQQRSAAGASPAAAQQQQQQQQAVPPPSTSPGQTTSALAAAAAANHHHHGGHRRGVTLQAPSNGGAAAVGIPIPSGGRRRGSDSSSEGFRDVLGADKWYVGGRTATGEERFFKLGVVRRVRSNDGLSLDRLSL